MRKVIIDNFPEYAVNYLMYGDIENMSGEDMENCDRFIEENNLSGACIDFNFDTKGFCSRPCFGLACECVTAIFAFPEKRQ